jgi:hypothetical protein
LDGVGGGGRGAGIGESFGKSEIEDFDFVFGIDFDVRGLEISMDDAAFVSVFERVGDLEEDLFGFGGWDWALRDAIGEGLTRDQFHHEGALFDAVDGRDPRMVQLGEDFRFALEASEAVGIGGEGVGEEFDGHFAVELGVERAVDFAHASLANQSLDLIVPELLAWTWHEFE